MTLRHQKTQHKQMKDKILRDSIHGYIEIKNDITTLIDTPQFQRLRDLKQLGVCCFVFPGATHDRFQHSIGVSHLAGKWINRIRHKQPELQIDDREVHLLRMAGLTHDLGHSIGSHVFDGEFLARVRPGLNWSHEDGSLMMLDAMIEKNNLDYERDDIRFVQSLILGSSSGVPGYQNESPTASLYREDDRRFLWQIVANKTNSIDVDKFDYLARDSYNLNLKISYDHSRLLRYNKVLEGEICFSSKEASNIYEMFHTRYSLHKQIYSHRVGKAIEYMLVDALIEADPVLHISDSIHNPDDYLHMTDYVITQIELSKDPALHSAQEIIKRMRRRQLYKFVTEVLLPPDFVQPVSEQDIVSHQDGNCQLLPTDLIVQDLKINYSMQDRDPVSRCKFYCGDSLVPKTIDVKSISLLMPAHFQERFLRVYVRKPEHAEAASVAFAKWCQANRATN